MRPAERVAAVVAAVAREGVVAAAELARHLLVGGPAPGDQHHVEAGQPEDGYDEEADDDHDHDGDDDGGAAQVVAVVQHVDEAEDEDGGHVHGERDEEHEEVAVVAAPDAVVDPRAVVVEHLDAVVADGAVRAAGRAVELAGHAPLHADLEMEC